jgi:diguanylate cyclase (GGDEF)-like protein/PAS domain S-box-containing protein
MLPTNLVTLSRQQMAVKMLLLAAAYFITGRLGLLLHFFGSNITLLWLPTGIAVAALSRWGYRYWPGVMVGAFATNLAIDSNPSLAAGIALGNTLGPLLAAYLLNQMRFHREFKYARDILLLVITAAIGMTVSASSGVASLIAFGVLPLSDLEPAWLAWWAGDFVGVLLAAPLLLNVSRLELKNLWVQRVEFSVWCLIALGVSYVVFFSDVGTESHFFALTFIVLPIVVWSAMRFGLMGSSLGALLPVVIAAIATSLGVGPFHSTDVHQGLLILWLFLVTLVLVGLMVAALQAKRKRTEETLRQSEADLRLLLNSVTEGIYGIDLQGRCTFINPSAIFLLGYQQESELLGGNIHGLIHHTHIDGTPYPVDDCRLYACMQSEDTVHIDNELFWRKDGSAFQVDAWSRPTRRDGQVIGAVVTFLDISQRKAMEQQLIASELQYRTIVDTEPECIKLLAFDGTVLQINPAGLQMLGADTDCQLIGKKAQDIVLPQYRHAFEALAQRVIGGESGILEFEAIGFKGVHCWLETHAVPMRDVQGKISALLCVTRNITDRKLAEETMRVASVAFETHEAILITDAKAIILRVNQSFQNITGFTAKEVVGQNPSMLQSGLHSPDFYRAMWSTIQDTGKWSGEIWDKRKNGEVFPKSTTITAVFNSNQEVTHYVAVFRDISQSKRSEQEIFQLAFYDPLTKLPNRRLLQDRLQQAMAVSTRNGWYGALLLLDLDNFKTINDTQGHATGDMLLIEVAQRLHHSIREGDSVARLGGDEFVVVLEELSNNLDEAVTQAELVAEKIRAELSHPYLLNRNENLTTPSIGICLFRGHQDSAENLFKHADTAMYQAKKAGRNAIRFFDPQMQMALEKRTALETDLRHALTKQQFRLYYQIQVDSQRHPIGAEVLLRWEHTELGLVSPLQFIPLAEETGLILPIGLWVLQTACNQLKRWQNEASTRNLTMAVNVSAKQFRQPEFVTQVNQVLQESGANPASLKLELTESVVLENVEDTITKMHELKQLGVSFSMDDFGTGYSSLQYLKLLPLNQIKIDQSFVRDIASDPNDAAIVQTIIAMTEALGLNVIAEGVETEAQCKFLDSHGCHAFQGYLFGRPVPVDEFEKQVNFMPLPQRPGT